MKITMNDKTVYVTDTVLSFAEGYCYINDTKVLIRHIIAIEPIKAKI